MEVSRARWLIVALVFAAAVLNYIDRQIIAVLKPAIQGDFGWNDQDYAHMASAFQFAAAAAYLFVGWFIDRTGLRWGYSWAVGVWSAAAAAHAAAVSVFQFTIARIVLGVSEAVHTPAAVKSVAVWFPRDAERSTALGIMASAGNLGAIVTPLLIPVIALALGWRATFVIAGGLGVVWVVLWLLVRTPPAVKARERAVGSETQVKVPWAMLLRSRPAWAIAGAKFIVDAVWWFVLFWIPDFFHRAFQLDMREAGPPVALIYGLAALGSFMGGWLPAQFLKRGASLNVARKGTMLAASLVILTLPLALLAENYWLAALIIGIALFAHQAFTTNVFGLCTDLFPPRFVGSVVSFGALLGNLSGMLFLEFTGWVLTSGYGYLPMFGYSAVAYILALGWIQLMAPRLVPAKIDA